MRSVTLLLISLVNVQWEVVKEMRTSWLVLSRRPL